MVLVIEQNEEIRYIISEFIQQFFKIKPTTVKSFLEAQDLNSGFKIVICDDLCVNKNLLNEIEKKFPDSVMILFTDSYNSLCTNDLRTSKLSIEKYKFKELVLAIATILKIEYKSHSKS